jgi:hypothetical protein
MIFGSPPFHQLWYDMERFFWDYPETKMATEHDFANFRAGYDDLTSEVERARHQFVAEHMANWFRILDGTSFVNRVIERLQSGLEFADFLKRSTATGSSMAGSGTFLWPEDQDQRLGMKLLLFREIAVGRIETWQLGHNFAYSGNDLDDNSSAIIRQIFMPMSRELRRYLESEVGNMRHDMDVPASDRTVRLDHNSPEYRNALEALDALEKALRGDNAFPNAEEKEQRIAEISATQRLLQTIRVSVRKIVAVGVTTASALAGAMYSDAIKQAASAALTWLKVLIGLEP